MNAPSLRQFVLLNEDDPSLPILNEGEDTIHVNKQMHLSFSSSEVGERGVLYITNRRVIWLGEHSYDIDVPYIILHAISHDVASFPRPCIYCQFDLEETVLDNEDEEDNVLSEMFLVPEEESDLQVIFEALSTAAMANPDEVEDDEAGQFFYDNTNVHLTADGEATLSHLDNLLDSA